MVARCNGGANTRFGTYSRGDDGRSWRIFSSDDVPSIFSKYSGDADSGNRWSFPAIFAASIGLVQTDIKRVLAYSTVSQLGYMMLALGSAGYVAGIFHLTTHAF